MHKQTILPGERVSPPRLSEVHLFWRWFQLIVSAYANTPTSCFFGVFFYSPQSAKPSQAFLPFPFGPHYLTPLLLYPSAILFSSPVPNPSNFLFPSGWQGEDTHTAKKLDLGSSLHDLNTSPEIMITQLVYLSKWNQALYWNLSFSLLPPHPNCKYYILYYCISILHI